MFYAGVDAGSRTIKVVLLDDVTMRVAGSSIADQGVEQAAIAHEAFCAALAQAGIKRADIANIVATGYGRNALAWANTTVTEITCQAYGVRLQAPTVRTIIDIGGQDSKLIRLDPNGVVRDFSMNDRCAAGTGRFLEIIAQRLGMQLEDIGALAAKKNSSVVISTMCVVFAETEITGLLASGESPGNIAAGVQDSIAKRIAAMAGGRVDPPIVFTGGVALISGMAEAIGAALHEPVTVADAPHMTAALGAALIAAGRSRHAGKRQCCGQHLEAVQ